MNTSNWTSVRRALLLMLFVGLGSAYMYAQQSQPVRCYTNEMDAIRHANDPTLQTNEEFESWLAKLIEHKKERAKSSLIIDGVYQIPVVVHVIHDGEAVGTGDNLSQAVIQSQIDVLNEDFRKLFGTPGWNTHVVGADTKIEFCLARRRPDGSAFPAGEDGINRIDRSTPGWTAPPYGTAYIDGTIKPWCTGTQFGGWDPADYMNFWVCDISGGILGYAQFPTTSMGGMGCAAQSTATDGVVMLTSSIGKSAVTGNPGPYNEGRTATHEIGHWLGLRHIWGDGGCGVDDFCADTPLSDNSNFGCATGHNSCPDNYASPPWPATDPNDMVENYMDYSDDACMNIFTYDQMTRMRTVLENSPIRASLITSDACIPPAVSDASIIDILAPLGDNCPGAITPQVTIKNRGSSTLTSATIEYTIDGGAPVTFSWTGSVASGATANVTLPASTPALGIHTIQAYSVLPNGVLDPDPTYDTTTLQFAVSNGYQPDYTQDFEAGQFPPDVRWLDVNANGDCMQWIGQSGTSSAGVFPNDAACVPFFQNNGSAQEEYLYTPIFILPCNATSAEVVFDHAYRRRTNASSDRLRLQMSTDCGATWSTTLFDQQGNALSTGANSNSYWIPGAAGDWSNNVIDLSAYVTGTSQNVQFRFRATNTGNQGGNVYVDNFEFNAVTPGEIEVSASGQNILDGGFYDFGAQPIGTPVTVIFTIDNTGTSDLTLTGPIVVTGAEYALNTTFGATTVPAGGSTTFSIDFTASGAGPFTGNVSFGTNDCDEGTYNFQLTGTGNVTPPVASFTAAPTTVCEGSTVTFTDASTAASSWTWTFPGGTPATATGVGPHTITYATAGTYNVQLDVSNVYGSDTDLQSNLINVLPGGTAALPIAEGFEGGVAPTNWTVVNGGVAYTWVQSGAGEGTAPTPGRSAVIDNHSTTFNPTGNIDDLVVEKFDLTGFASSQLTFDVAYARYDGTYFDQLDVLVSTDCGATYTTVFSKSGTTLATDADQTTAYTPNTWRNEVVDLSAYVGNPSVEVVFRNVSGWGNFLYLDNVNITGIATLCDDPDVPTVTYTPTTVCDGNTATLNISGNLDDATDWYIYSGSCGGTLLGSTATTTYVVTPTAPSSTYYIRGEGGCVTPGTCGNVTVNVTPIEDASFSFGAASYCTGDSDPTPTITGVTGGTFSSGGGLSIDPASGAIDVSASTPGSYTVTYTTPGACSGNSNVAVTINATPTIASGTVTNPSTCGGTDGTIQITGSGTGVVTWSGAASGNSGTVTLPYTITGLAQGTYNVSFDDGCVSNTVNETLTDPTAPTIAQGTTVDPTFCGATNGSIQITGTGTGVVSWTGTATGNSGVVTLPYTLTGLAQGSYDITFNDGCVSNTVSVTLSDPAAPSIAQGTTADPTTCAGTDGSIQVTGTGTGVVSWTGTATGNSGIVTLPYTITGLAQGAYSISYNDGCASNSLSVSLNDPATPAAPVVTVTNNCGSSDLSATGTNLVWSTTETTATINVTTAGPYTVTQTVAGCISAPGTGVAAPLTIPTIATGTTGDPSTCSGSDGTVQITGTGTGVISWTGAATGNSGTVTLPHTVTGLVQGTYNFTFNDGCASNTTSATLTDPTGITIATGSTSNPSTCGGTNGSIQITGTGTGIVSWTGTASGNSGAVTLPYTISGLAQGTYSITFDDGCISNTLNESLSDPGAPVIAQGTTTNPSTCLGTDGSIQITGTGTGIVSWTGAASGNSGSVTLPYTVSGLAQGSYSITFDDGCTSNTLNATLTDPSTPAAPVVTVMDNCESSDLTATGSNLMWSTTETSSTINVTVAGSYTVTQTVAGCTSAPGAGIAAPLTIPSIAVGTTNDPTTCTGTNGSVQITGAGTGVVSWTGAATGNTGTVTLPYTVSGLGQGTYSFTFVDACTSNSVNATLTDPTPVTIAQGTTVNPTVCAGTDGSIQITGTGTGIVSWSGAATGNSGIVTLPYTITGLAQGAYAVSFDDGCTSNTLNISLSDPAATTITQGTTVDPTSCGGNDGTIQITGTGTGVVTWSGAASGNSGVVTLPYTMIALTQGTYSISFNDGCTSNTLNVTLSDPATPAAPVVTVLNNCGESVLTATGANLVWSTTETVASITVTTAGSYTVTQTVAGCTSVPGAGVAAPLMVPAQPVVTANGPLTFCAGDSVELTSDQSSGNVWSTTETMQSISVNSTGAYFVTYTASNGCSANSDTLDVSVNANPNAPTITASGATTFCEGGSVDLSSSETTGIVWSTTETTPTITVASSGTYTVTYTDGNGCSATSVATTVTENAIPTVTHTLISEVCDTDPAFTLSGGSPAGGTYSGTGVSGNLFDPSVAGAGTHTLTYVYTDGNGCSDSTTVDLLVKACAGIDELEEGLSIYPNPTAGDIHVSTTGSIIENIIVYDVRGRLVAEYNEFASQVIIDLSSTETGVYTVEVRTNKSLSRTRLVKQ